MMNNESPLVIKSTLPLPAKHLIMADFLENAQIEVLDWDYNENEFIIWAEDRVEEIEEFFVGEILKTTKYYARIN